MIKETDKHNIEIVFRVYTTLLSDIVSFSSLDMHNSKVQEGYQWYFNTILFQALEHDLDVFNIMFCRKSAKKLVYTLHVSLIFT